MRFAVTCRTIKYRFGRNALDFMLDCQVTLTAFDLVFRNVHTVHKGRVTVSFKPVRLEVARTAILSWYEPVANHCLVVTLHTGKILLKYGSVIEPEIYSVFSRNRFPIVTGLTGCQSLGLGWVHVAGLLHMAEKTCRLGDEQMFSLHNLRVTTRASQFFPSPKFTEVMAMIKNDPLEDDRSF